jgi:hypothetical protein
MPLYSATGTDIGGSSEYDVKRGWLARNKTSAGMDLDFGRGYDKIEGADDG